MAFYDYDLTDQIAGQHELWEIGRVVGFSSLLYRGPVAKCLIFL